MSGHSHEFYFDFDDDHMSESDRLANVTNINDTTLDELNVLIAAVVSLIFNIALIFATVKTKIFSESARKMQIFSCILRLIFSIIIVLCSPTLAYIDEAKAVYIVKGGFELPLFFGEEFFGEVVLVLFLTFVIFSCLGPPAQFIQTCLIIKRSNMAHSQNKMFIVTTIFAIILASIGGYLVIYGYIPDDDDHKLSVEIVYFLNGKGSSAFLIASTEKYSYELHQFVPDQKTFVCTGYIISIFIVSTIIVGVCYYLIEAQRKQQSKSESTTKSQKQLSRILLVQFALPLFTIHIPFYITFAAPLFDLDTDRFSIFLPFLFSWCPALNPILVMILVKSIREKILLVRAASNRFSSVNFSSKKSTNKS